MSLNKFHMGQCFTKLKLTEIFYERSSAVLILTILSAFTIKHVKFLSHITFLATKFSQSMA